MKGEIMLRVLEGLSEFATNTFDLLDAILSAGYGASMRKIEYEIERNRAQREALRMSREEEALFRRRYVNALHKLKKDGLIRLDEKKKFSITAKGLRMLASLRKKKKDALPPPRYARVERRELIIVAFDVPERERRKRDWIRTVLFNLGFRMVQKSVWMGNIKIPEEFLHDLKRMKMIGYIDIFAVSKSGTLEQVA